VTLGGIGFLALVVLAPAGPMLPAQIPIRIDFDAPAGCSDAEAFYTGVLARMNRVRRARTGEAALRLAVRLTRTGGRVHGELQVGVGGEGGASDTRRVDGATCAEVVQVLSLTAALAIDPTAGLPVAAAPEKPAPAAASPVSPRPPSAPAAPPAPSPRVDSTPQLYPQTAQPAPPTVTPPPPPTSTPAVNVALASPATAPPTPAVLAAAPPPPRVSGWELGAALVAAEIVSPFFSAGAGVTGRVGTTTRDGFTPSAALGLLFLPTDFFQSGDDVRIRFAALALTGCPGLALRARVEIEPCARVAVGLLGATDRSVNRPRSVDLPWWSAGLLLRAVTRLGGSGFTLELAGGIDLPLLPRSFVITNPAHPVGETPRVSPSVSLGIGHGL
jgi:hypothetical protein